MTQYADDICLPYCLQAVEVKLGRGDSTGWSGYDFEKLGEAILADTGVNLSITTLKRLWGKLKYDNLPTVNTLNTLARYAGHADWQAFKQQCAVEAATVPPPVPAMDRPLPGPRAAKLVKKRWLYLLPGLTGLLLVVYVSIAYKSHAPAGTLVNTAGYSFSSKTTVASGVPSSVVFSYNASESPSDSVFIAQSWDVSRKVAVPKNQTRYSTIYYYPGYFRAKLMIGAQIVKEHDLFINSGGWMALVHRDPIPLYLKQEEYLRSDRLEVNAATLQSHNLDMQPLPPQLQFINVKDMGPLRTDNFVFETAVKSDYKEGAAACQYVRVLLLCKNDVFIIPLCAKGCVGDIGLAAAGVQVTSANADLSGFGCDLSNWVKLRVEAHNKQVHFYVNDHEAYSLTFPNAPCDIVGVQYRFNGTGAIKDTRFIDGKRVVQL
ncbi:hypothetical protein [Deminuibacter soli]|uniref:Uncharacterized protein n=1 Tax=Deminuibacter soli TaxID=2291815 RepID=A0A3E1NCW7_9BACT|nr:hypothetical protein [Deminuibacter soli]RFM25702.1 hypothetical protein DXN05_23620 [Deminuibacter soli]